MSFQILRLSATSLLSHLLRTVPPTITCQSAANYDALMAVAHGHHNGGGGTLRQPPSLRNKALLLDITIVNPCAGSNLGNAARHVGKYLADAVERKKNKYRGSFPATYFPIPLATSTCGDVGSDVHALIKELAIRRVQHRSETYFNESQH